ncbi:MAG: serine/threonine-protein kinase, partial [Myxococcota bacterium]
MQTTASVCPHDGSATNPVKSLPGGTRIGDYTVVRTLGEGGMGFVYEVRHEVLHRRAAMKFLHPELARNPSTVARFVQEAKAVNLIGHDNIVDIYDYGERDDGVVYLVMEFLDGEPLSARLAREGRLPSPLLVHIFAQVLRALSAAHDRQIVHRDLKPDNIFLIRRHGDTHFAKLLDFGIARLLDDSPDTPLTRKGMLIGTPHFMSPEQAAGKPADQRSDIFSIGTLMYQAAVGTMPFDGEMLTAILGMILLDDPPPPRQAAPDGDIPAALEQVIVRAMHKEPERRYRDAGEMLAAL